MTAPVREGWAYETVERDAWDDVAWAEIMVGVPVVGELAQQLADEGVLDPESLLRDITLLFLQQRPRVRDAIEMQPSRRGTRDVVAAIAAMEQTEALHQRTHGDQYGAALALVAVSDSLLAMLRDPDTDQDTLDALNGEDDQEAPPPPPTDPAESQEDSQNEDEHDLPETGETGEEESETGETGEEEPTEGEPEAVEREGEPEAGEGEPETGEPTEGDSEAGEGESESEPEAGESEPGESESGEGEPTEGEPDAGEGESEGDGEPEDAQGQGSPTAGEPTTEEDDLGDGTPGETEGSPSHSEPTASEPTASEPTEGSPPGEGAAMDPDGALPDGTSTSDGPEEPLAARPSERVGMALAERTADALEEAADDLDDEARAFADFGLDPADARAMDFDARRSAAEALGKGPLAKFARLFGRFRAFAAAAAARRVEYAREEAVGIELGKDPTALIASELALMGNPLLRRDLFIRIAEGRALVVIMIIRATQKKMMS